MICKTCNLTFPVLLSQNKTDILKNSQQLNASSGIADPSSFKSAPIVFKFYTENRKIIH